MSDLVETAMLPDPVTGELLPAVPANAARVWRQAADIIDRMRELQHECGWVLGRLAESVGKKTLDIPGGYAVTMTGGETVEYDVHDLQENLAKAGVPESRINEAVVPTVSYRVNRSVLKQLAGANPDYAAAIEASSTRVVKPWRARVA